MKIIIKLLEEWSKEQKEYHRAAHVAKNRYKENMGQSRHPITGKRYVTLADKVREKSSQDYANHTRKQVLKKSKNKRKGPRPYPYKYIPGVYPG